MEDESFELTWPTPARGQPAREEVICGIDNGCAIMQSASDVCEEVVVQEDVIPETIVPDENQANIMYLAPDNVLVMQQSQPGGFQDQFMECQVTEEVITDDWVNSQGEERVEIPVGEVGAEQQIEYDDTEIPLPTDQDEYTASRPYPCDFCSRRFRKKANLMNHMVAHQTDRPHGCNLCGARYIRKCDLMNHLKIHAYVPDSDGLDDEDELATNDSSPKKKKPGRKRKNQSVPKPSKVKLENNDADDRYESTSTSHRTYNYVDEDVRLLAEMENHANTTRHNATSYMYKTAVEPRYPITDSRKPFVCQHCGVSFAREKALASHARIHAGDSPFECESCNEMFWDMNKMKEHMRTKHAGQNYNDLEEDDDYISEESYGDFYCNVCGVRYHRNDLLKRHMRTHDSVKEEFEMDDSEYNHVCNVCGQSFPEPLDLLAHAEIHARNLGHRCMICGESFGDEQEMSAHVVAAHGKNLPANSCLLCGKTCKDRKTLLKHSWDHSHEKLYSCSKCAKSFHNKARLKRHMASHRNKSVQCDVCGLDFPDGRTLMNHRHSHTNFTGRQFPCRECGKTFGSRSSQQIHIRIHTGERPYGCRFCWKAFADGGTLRKHERIHTGEKPYACAVCPRAFNQRVVLREHIRSHHSGPDPQYSHTMTPYCCSVCNDMFSTSQDLIVHLIHHCDLNTAMKRQPQVGPRKYKRRRKLKPHELELISTQHDDNEVPSDPEERVIVKRTPKTPKKLKAPAKASLEKDYESVFQSFDSALQNISSIIKTSGKGRKKKEGATAVLATRPKMIHTQKTRVSAPVDGKSKHKTKTMITRTTPGEMKPNPAERNRPRTKNVSYHVLQPEKYQAATFESAAADNTNTVLIKTEMCMSEPDFENIVTEIPDVANEETVLAHVEDNAAASISIVTNANLKKNNLTPGRHIIGPGNKVIRIVKGGMLVSNKFKKETEVIVPDLQPPAVNFVNVPMKQEILEQSPLHELAELSMQHAQNQFRCEMCSATFNDRSQLLMHVPIHI